MKKIILFIFVLMCFLTFVGCGKRTKINAKTSNTTIINQSSNTSANQETKYIITVINGSGSGEYIANSNTVIEATIPSGKEFCYWLKNNVKISEQNPYNIVVSGNDIYEAVFKNETIRVEVINGKASGTFEIGSEVTVTADTKEDEIFNHWEIDGKNVSSENPYTFILSGEVTVEAIYDKINRISSYTTNVIKKNEEFKVLNFADIQLHDGDDSDLALHIIDTLVEKENPDMIVILGDTLNDSVNYDCKETAKKIVEHIDSLGIPWAPVFGNHDNKDYRPANTKKSVGVEYLMELFSKCDNCLFIEGPKDVLGKSNYLVNVIDEDTKEIVKSLIFLDSKVDGLDDTSASFYTECIEYVKELTGGKTIPSIIFDHIPIQEYMNSIKASEAIEYKDIVGFHAGNGPLVDGSHKVFEQILELGSTKTVICGHDHEDAYFNAYQGIVLAHGLKSSTGDDEDGVAFRHPLGGLVLIVSDKDDELYYSRVEDVSYKILSGSDFPFHPNVVPYFMYSGGKLVFDIELPSTGTIKFNLEGTNLMRDSVKYEHRVGNWNRLTTNITIDASSKTADLGHLSLISGNTYRFELDLKDFELNKSNGEEACGDETLRLVYFHSATGAFTVTNVHIDFEEILEENQKDLSEAIVSSISDQFFNNLPRKPEPIVTLDGITLEKGKDIVYCYSNNSSIGEATLTIVPSGSGAHLYKGSISVTFNIVSNPDDDTKPGHESAITVNGNNSYVTNEKNNDWIKVNDWYNCGQKLHIELKRLENGANTSGETVRFTLMGANTNEGEGQCDRGGNWNRLTGYYIIDFSNNSVVCYEYGNKNNVIATGVSIGDGWFSLEIDFKLLILNSAENVHGNDKEIMQRVEFSQLSRSFKFDNASLAN